MQKQKNIYNFLIGFFLDWTKNFFLGLWSPPPEPFAARKTDPPRSGGSGAGDGYRLFSLIQWEMAWPISRMQPGA